MTLNAGLSEGRSLARPYQGYAYSYPHKSAYRPMDPPVRLRDIWAGEDLSRLFLYVHVPFCEMRCGFCNLFTTVNPRGDLVRAYLDALERQAAAVRDELGDARAVRLALGGGTPTFLQPRELARLFDLAGAMFGGDPAHVAASVEVSPKTATGERLDLLAGRGVHRISIGAQSFFEEETRAMGRPQKIVDLEAALDQIRARPFPCLNIDLIYGAANQSVESWLASLARTLHWQPEELYLYPLYVRPLTGLDGRAGIDGEQGWDAHRLALYRAGRDFLGEMGYRQVSMRMFRRKGSEATPGSADASAEYSCQDDGMLGLGAGARSYTRNVHYSSEYAVGRRGVLEIIRGFCAEPEGAFRQAGYGVLLDSEEQIRRFILKSILRADGLDRGHFAARFGLDPLAACPDLEHLLQFGYLERHGEHLVPTAFGLARSDAIGPWLYSDAVRAAMRGFELR